MATVHVYVNDFLDFSKDLTLQAVGGQVFLTATVSPPNGKAYVTESGNVTISGFDISGVTCLITMELLCAIREAISHW
jgi:hypothetical protein